MTPVRSWGRPSRSTARFSASSACTASRGQRAADGGPPGPISWPIHRHQQRRQDRRVGLGQHHPDRPRLLVWSDVHTSAAPHGQVRGERGAARRHIDGADRGKWLRRHIGPAPAVLAITRRLADRSPDGRLRARPCPGHERCGSDRRHGPRCQRRRRQPLLGQPDQHADATPIPIPGRLQQAAISTGGLIAGAHFDTTISRNSWIFAWRCPNRNLIQLRDPGFTNTPQGVNAAGQIVGTSDSGPIIWPSPNDAPVGLPSGYRATSASSTDGRQASSLARRYRTWRRHPCGSCPSSGPTPTAPHRFSPISGPSRSTPVTSTTPGTVSAPAFIPGEGYLPLFWTSRTEYASPAGDGRPRRTKGDRHQRQRADRRLLRHPIPRLLVETGLLVRAPTSATDTHGHRRRSRCHPVRDQFRRERRGVQPLLADPGTPRTRYRCAGPVRDDQSERHQPRAPG